MEPTVAGDAAPTRVPSGLVVFYDFNSFDGSDVKDRAGVGEPLHLRIADGKTVRNRDHALEVLRKTQIHSEKPATRLGDAIKQSGAITIEAWLRPAKNDQSGPARIATLSRNANDRNFALGRRSSGTHPRVRAAGVLAEAARSQRAAVAAALAGRSRR